MNQNVIKTLSFIFLILHSSTSLWAQNNEMLPPILDYYPNCSYDVLDTVKMRVLTVKEPEAEVVTKLLQTIQKKAQLAGADALILINRRVNGIAGWSSTSAYLSYKAEFIKLCKESNTSDRKLAPVDPQGRENYGVKIAIKWLCCR